MIKNNKIRVVFDTNVFLSAFNWKDGIPEKIYYSAIKQHFILLISPSIISEIARKLREKFFWEEERIIDKLKEVIRKSVVILPKQTIFAIQDEPDNRILECAVEGNANLIVSGDRHLLKLKEYNNIPIIKPIDFYHILEKDNK